MAKARASLSVREWSQTVTPADFELRHLDYYLFTQYNDILQALGVRNRLRSGTGSGEGRELTKEDLFLVPLFVMPVASFCALGGEGRLPNGGWASFDGFNAGLGVVVVAVTFLFSLVGPPLALRQWSRHGRQWSAPGLGFMAAPIVCGILTLVGMALRWDYPLGGIAAIPVWLSLALTLICLGIIAAGSPRPNFQRDPSAFAQVGRPDQAKAVELFEQLAPRDAQLPGQLATPRTRDAARAWPDRRRDGVTGDRKMSSSLRHVSLRGLYEGLR